MKLPSILKEMLTPNPYSPKGRQIRIENSIKSMTRLMDEANKQGWERDSEAKVIYCRDVVGGESLSKKEIKDLERILKSQGENAWKVSNVEGSWLGELEKMYNKDDPFRSHVVPWMQNYLAALPQPAKRAPDLLFKIAIVPILDVVPSIFPKDLPQTLKDGEWWNDKQLEYINTLNDMFPVKQMDAIFPWPITSNVVFQIIAAAQKYEEEFSGKSTS